VILPIVAGLSWGLLRLPLPDTIDAPLALLGTASGPCSLVLLGASLASYGIRQFWREAVVLMVLKNIGYPLLIWTIGQYIFGLDGLAIAIVTVTAALPMGANVFLFAQRYQVAQGEITAAVHVDGCGRGDLDGGAAVVQLRAVLRSKKRSSGGCARRA
jgi:predicted permease